MAAWWCKVILITCKEKRIIIAFPYFDELEQWMKSAHKDGVCNWFAIINGAYKFLGIGSLETLNCRFVNKYWNSSFHPAKSNFHKWTVMVLILLVLFVLCWLQSQVRLLKIVCEGTLHSYMELKGFVFYCSLIKILAINVSHFFKSSHLLWRNPYHEVLCSRNVFSYGFRDKALCAQLQMEVQRMQIERKVVAGVARLYGALNMLLIPCAWAKRQNFVIELCV